MTRRARTVALAVALMLITALPAVAEDHVVEVPTATAALGDSITRAFHSDCGLLNDCPANSWSTGSAVDSHVTRLEMLSGTAIRGDNLAVTGADSGDLVAQAQGIAADVGYVTILMGANDACTDTVGQMTPVGAFQVAVSDALDVIHTRAPDAAVYIATIPDLRRLWEVGSTSGSARFAWWLYGICQSMLAAPLSTQATDVQRRETVRQRVIAYNSALATECTTYSGTCRTDGGAVFGHPFELGQLSTIDYFHPNVSGQQVLAAVTWDAGYAWTTGEPPPPVNQEPVADAGPDQTIAADESNTATVTLDGSGSSDPDGDELSYAWTWAGGSASGASPTVTLDAGATTVALVVDDGNDGTATDSVSITVDPYDVPPPTEVAVHVGDLDGSSDPARRNRWDAAVVVTVHDAGDNPVVGVQVQGSWSDGANGGGSCVTEGDGTCTVTRSGIKSRESSATWTVDTLSAADTTYNSSTNHDPDGDGDSNGTVVVVAAP